jgi:hypothetical protein
MDFARTRLHTGTEAPNTYFVGRALKDSGEFGFDFIKVKWRFHEEKLVPLIINRSSTRLLQPLLQRSSLDLQSARSPWTVCGHPRWLRTCVLFLAMRSETTDSTCKYHLFDCSRFCSIPFLAFSSAAFNLNHPIVDDLDPNEAGEPRLLTEQMDIGRRGIELAALGGFDKCTWDGAADTYPSRCESPAPR